MFLFSILYQIEFGMSKLVIIGKMRTLLDYTYFIVYVGGEKEIIPCPFKLFWLV